MKQIVLSFLAIVLCGCSSNKTEVKRIYERPWIGGSFETAPAPAEARERKFKKNGALVTRANPQTPLAKGGLREGDLILAINEKYVGSERALRNALDKTSSSPVTFAFYRDGEFSHITVTPGVERYQHINHVMFAIGFKTNLEIDFFPNPDFSFIALGFETEPKRVDLTDPNSKYLSALRAREKKPAEENPWQGLTVDEGWKAWLGPISVSQNKVIVSQEAGQ